MTVPSLPLESPRQATTAVDIFTIAAKSGAGAAAMVANVACLMWLRTTVKYQYRNGVPFQTALRSLYSDGGIPRFYRGVVPALVLGPLARFGDTAANTGMPILLDQWDATRNMTVASKTAFASGAAALYRVFLMPLDTVEATMQVTGKFSNVVTKIRKVGFSALYHGSFAAASANFVGHFPWYFTYNFLSVKIPKQDDSLNELGRRAILGFSASLLSDTCSNSIRVVKCYKQTSIEKLTYPRVITIIVSESGITGLLFRGLKTKILINGLQGIVFSVVWKKLEDVIFAERT